MARNKKQLIVSFVGRQDLKHFGLDAGPAQPRDTNDSSPILRLLRQLANEPAANVESSILLFDDEPATGARFEFAKRLAAVLHAESITRYSAPQVCNITGHSGPTDLGGLLKAVWARLDLPKEGRPDDIVFHVSSGTPAMHAALMVVAMCLYERSRMFETSNRPGHNATPIKPPFSLGLKMSVRSHAKAPAKLPDKARNTLKKGLVASDPFVEAEFAALFKSASKATPPRVLIRGPGGSGKWQAALQFARWRGKSHPTIEWNDPQSLAATPVVTCRSTVVIRHLDRWSADELRALLLWTEAHPLAAVAATWREDRPPRVPLRQAIAEGLRGAGEILLPALFARDDMVEVAQAMASSLGLHATHVHERLQYDLRHASRPRTMHELNTLLAHAYSRSPDRHVTQSAFEQGMEMHHAQEAMAKIYEAFDAVLRLQFTPERGIEAVLEDVKHAAARLAAEHGRTQADVARILGCKRSTAGNWLRAATGPKPSPTTGSVYPPPGNGF